MGLMDQFRQPQNRLSEVLRTAQQIGGNDPKAVLQHMADQGMTCNLPNGKVVPIKDMLTMAEGSTPQQLLSRLGL